MECDDSVHNSFVKVVHEKVESVVPFVSDTVKTYNSLKSDNCYCATIAYHVELNAISGGRKESGQPPRKKDV